MRNGIRRRLFGTDGIRARVGEFPLDPGSLLKFGQVLGNFSKKSKILIGRDTRESGVQFEHVLSLGLGNSAEVYSCQVIPTPGLSYVMDHADFDYGIMLTASHNPYHDNGIKIFTRGGEKISDEIENQLENMFFHSETVSDDQAAKPAKIQEFSSATDLYEEFLYQQAEDCQTGGLKCVLDCANGATYKIAPRIFEKLGMETITIHVGPNGKNINEKCGSTDLLSLKQTVLNQKADMGIAFDGDGDRVLFIDRQGFVIDGDLCLFIISEYLNRLDPDFNRILVGTVMTNMGLEQALLEKGMELVRTDVGDRFVYQEMKKRNAILGGEKSGHIILRNLQKSGDGILTALYFLKSLAFLKIDIDEVKNRMVLFPQVIKNIPVREKKNLKEWKELQVLMDRFKTRYGKNSRVLIRYSGTESKIRLMMESRDKTIIEGNMELFMELIESTIGE